MCNPWNHWDPLGLSLKVVTAAGARGIHDLPCATKLRSWMGREG